MTLLISFTVSQEGVVVGGLVGGGGRRGEQQQAKFHTNMAQKVKWVRHNVSKSTGPSTSSIWATGNDRIQPRLTSSSVSLPLSLFGIFVQRGRVGGFKFTYAKEKEQNARGDGGLVFWQPPFLTLPSNFSTGVPWRARPRAPAIRTESSITWLALCIEIREKCLRKDDRAVAALPWSLSIRYAPLADELTCFWKFASLVTDTEYKNTKFIPAWGGMKNVSIFRAGISYLATDWATGQMWRWRQRRLPRIAETVERMHPNLLVQIFTWSVRILTSRGIESCRKNCFVYYRFLKIEREKSEGTLLALARVPRPVRDAPALHLSDEAVGEAAGHGNGVDSFDFTICINIHIYINGWWADGWQIYKLQSDLLIRCHLATQLSSGLINATNLQSNRQTVV